MFCDVRNILIFDLRSTILKQLCVRRMCFFLYIAVKHHTAVLAGNIWGSKGCVRILVSHNPLLYVIHGI